jgi:hypothetical protein
MENEIQPNVLPVQPLSLTPTPIPTQSSTNGLKILIFTVLGLAIIAGSVFVGIQIGKSQTPSQQSNAVQPTSSPTQTVVNSTAQPTTIPTNKPTIDWKIYANTKYGYSLKHPNDYLVGYADVRIGTFNKSNGNEDQVDFLPSEVEEFNNFLQIQVSDLKSYNKSLTEVIDGIYQQQKSHIQTTDISSVAKSKFVGYDDYEYTFSGQAFYTLSWGGTVKSGKYKAIFFQKDGNIYSFYLKDTDIFNQILSTFKFTN